MLDARYKRVHERMVLRLLQEHESTRLSLYNDGQIDDDRECPLVCGEKLIVVISESPNEYLKKTMKDLTKRLRSR